MSKKTWLRFEEESDTGKTKVWSVWNADNGSLLGHVRWRGAWRQYVYDTSEANYGVVWNPDCMDELTRFIRKQMAFRAIEKLDKSKDWDEVETQ